MQTFLTNVLKESFFNLQICLTFNEKNIAKISLNNFVRWQFSSSRRRLGLQLEMCVRALIDNFCSNLWSERMSFDIFFFFSKIELAILTTSTISLWGLTRPPRSWRSIRSDDVAWLVSVRWELQLSQSILKKYLLSSRY